MLRNDKKGVENKVVQLFGDPTFCWAQSKSHTKQILAKNMLNLLTKLIWVVKITSPHDL